MPGLAGQFGAQQQAKRGRTMKSQSIFRLHMPILMTFVVAALAIGAGAKTDGDEDNKIVGSWHVTVSFDDGRPPVQALYTFNRSNTFTMGGSWPGLFGPGHGIWAAGDNKDSGSVDLTFFRLLYTPAEDEGTGALTGAFSGTLKVQARLTVSDDGQSFSGTYLLTNYKTDGTVKSTSTGGLNGTPVVLDPLP
jgi:hypothetical protein